MDIILEMLFLTLSNIETKFFKQKLNWKSYTTIEAFLTIKQVGLVKKKEFTTTSIDPDDKTLIIYIASITSTDFYSSCRA